VSAHVTTTNTLQNRPFFQKSVRLFSFPRQISEWLYSLSQKAQGENDSYWNLSARAPPWFDGPTVVTRKDRKLLGDGIRKYRKLEGLTQERLAEKVDLNPVYMGQIERGYKIPTVDVLLRVARALKVRLRDIVHEL
jgi:DNA-binding XRE family transcriptional regulator